PLAARARCARGRVRRAELPARARACGVAAGRRRRDGWIGRAVAQRFSRAAVGLMIERAAAVRTLLLLLSIPGFVLGGPRPCHAKPTAGVPARYFLASTPPPVAGASAIVLTRHTVAILDGCPAHAARIKVTRQATRVKARWRRGCAGIQGPARLVASIAAPACQTPQGTCTAGAAVTVQADRCHADIPVLPPLQVIPVNDVGGTFATFAAQPPGSRDWYLVEQRGTIRIIRNGVFLATAFLDVQAGMGTNPGER